MKCNTFASLQAQYDEALAGLREAKSRVKALEAELKERGYAVVKGKVITDEPVTCAVVKWLYYQRYVGEMGMVCDYDEYAVVMKRPLAEYVVPFRVLQERKKMAEDRLSDYFEFFGLFSGAVDHQYFELPTEVHRNSWLHEGLTDEQVDQRVLDECRRLFRMFQCEEKELRFRYRGDSDQGEMVEGSGFTVSVRTSGFVARYKAVSMEDSFDWDGCDQVEW